MHPHFSSGHNSADTFDAALSDVARIYRSITGRELPRSNHPVLPSPPERDPQRVAEVVLEQLASLLERHARATPSGTWASPPVDCWESPGELGIVIDLPGLDESTLRVELREGALHVSGQRERLHFEGARPVAIERQADRYERQILLPAGITAEPIEAELHRGVLRLKLSRKEGSPVTRVVEVRERVG